MNICSIDARETPTHLCGLPPKLIIFSLGPYVLIKYSHSVLFFFLGTEAWIDAAGFLRQKDYIADKEGYRILKSKTIFVGQGRGIEVTIK